MVNLNEELLRKRSEHNEATLSDLQEVSLHQHEIEKIECVGKLCKHLKILLLQNNIISKMENLHKLKELEYLNLALNNVEVIENIAPCESLRKLDLTVNYIDFDSLDLSLSNLKSNYNLEDLYLTGNPITLAWASKYREYVIARLPQLKQLDGQMITPTERISAQSRMEELHGELSVLASDVSKMKAKGTYASGEFGSFTRQSRIEMYRELGKQKAEKEKADRARMGVPEPKPPREPASVLNSRGEIRQCNEGGYHYSLNDDSGDCIVFELHAPKYLDSSLIVLDLNPTYIRIVVKNKVTQVKLDDEIVVSASRVERSRTTGVLKCICPYEIPKARRLTSCAKSDCVMPKLEWIC